MSNYLDTYFHYKDLQLNNLNKNKNKRRNKRLFKFEIIYLNKIVNKTKTD